MAHSTISVQTGVYTTAFRNKIEVRWVKNPETNIQGYNVYNSTTSGGGISGYVKLNSVLVEEFNEVKQDVVSENTVVTENGGQRTTVTQQTLQDVFVFLYTHENITEESKQYYVITAVDTDGNESPPSIEVDGTPLIISTEIVLQPLRTRNDVSLDYIATLLDRTPRLDVKPGTVTRQLHIDPNSLEFSHAYVRTDFTSRSQSFLTLDNLDDEDGDGVSDPVVDSHYKLLLKSAYFQTTDAETQSMIDFAFDKLAANSGTTRKDATNATGVATFYTDIAPSVDLTVPFETEISTVPTETEAAIVFKTLAEVTMEVANIDTYFNEARQRYELNVSIEATEPAAAGNVNVGTIINSTVAGLRVTNLVSTFGGTDEESNSSLSDRAQLAYVGLDVGTAAGYKKTVTKVPSVTDVIIVDAGDDLMQRDYDEVRLKHVFGKVDIYIRGGTLTQVQDIIGFLFNQLTNQTMEIVDVTDFIVKTTNSLVTVSKPIFSVSGIRNVTKGSDYDLTGNWTIFKNGTEMTKTSEVSVELATGDITFESPLITGDVITSNYDYKVDVAGETIIDPALGGEVNFILDNFPVVKESYTIYKNGTALTETVDYTLNLANGFIQLTSGLIAGDALTADYQYIVPVISEIVISSATGGETEAELDSDNILESFRIESDGVTIDIEETNVINASIGMVITDLINATFRYRDSDPILLLNQPAQSIVSVVGSVSGELAEGVNYTFNNIDDILLEGNSIKAQRTVQITYANGIPIGDLLDGTEEVVLINNEFTALSQKGIDTSSIIVKSEDGITTYAKNSDYLVKDEEDGVNVQIARSVTTTIPNGSTVIISYQYGELITITYTVNPLVQVVQEAIEPVRNVTADVLVKAVLETSINFDISAVIKAGSDDVAVASDIRTAVSNEIAKKQLGVGVAQSDIIRAIELVTNVESVLVPLTTMVKANGTQITREAITTDFTLFQSSTVASYTTGSNALLQSTLGSNATDGYYAIFEDDRPLTLVTSENDVDTAAGQGFISSTGAVIISTIDSDTPDAHNYTADYVVNGETGAKDISITSLEFLAVGEMVVTTAFAG